MKAWFQRSCARAFRVAFASVAIVALTACGQHKGPGDGPPAQCAKEYERCALKPGVLGVCNVVDCAPDQQPPCLVCRSQH